MSWGMDTYSAETLASGNSELEAAELTLPGDHGPAYTPPTHRAELQAKRATRAKTKPARPTPNPPAS